jgi:hypothetical protein
VRGTEGQGAGYILGQVNDDNRYRFDLGAAGLVEAVAVVVVDLAEDVTGALALGAAHQRTEGQGAGYILGQVNDDNRYRFDQACRTKAIELAGCENPIRRAASSVARMQAAGS